MSEVEITAGERRRHRLGAFVRERKGATAVEFALIAMPFLAVLAGLMQTFLLYFAQSQLESAVRQAGRLIMTGQVQAAQMTQTSFQTKTCTFLPALFTCGSVMVDVEVANNWTSANVGMPPLTYGSNGQVNNTWQFNTGNAGDIVVVRVIYLWPVFFGPIAFNMANQPNGTREIMATAAFQNEPAIQ